MSLELKDNMEPERATSESQMQELEKHISQKLSSIEEMLENYTLESRFVTIGMDSPQAYFNTEKNRGKALERYIPQQSSISYSVGALKY